MAGIAAIDLARIHDVGEVVDRAHEAVDDVRQARRAAIAAVMDRVDHVLEVDRLLPQAIDARRRGGESLSLAYIGRRRIMAGGACLGVVIAVVAVHLRAGCGRHRTWRCRRRAPRDRCAAGHVAVADHTRDRDLGRSGAGGDDAGMSFDDDADVGNGRARRAARRRAVGGRRAGSGVGEVSVNAPAASGPVSALAGTPPPAQPVAISGFKEIGCPQVEGAGVAALPQLV